MATFSNMEKLWRSSDTRIAVSNRVMRIPILLLIGWIAQGDAMPMQLIINQRASECVYEELKEG